jgi:hypothetical protein
VWLSRYDPPNLNVTLGHTGLRDHEHNPILCAAFVVAAEVAVVID